MSTCPFCNKTYSGKGGGHCVGGPYGGCCETFGSNSIGDAHRVGAFNKDEEGKMVGPPGNRHPWGPRRCLTPDEMRAKGWSLNKHGAWVGPPPKSKPASWRSE